MEPDPIQIPRTYRINDRDYLVPHADAEEFRNAMEEARKEAGKHVQKLSTFTAEWAERYWDSYEVGVESDDERENEDDQT